MCYACNNVALAAAEAVIQMQLRAKKISFSLIKFKINLILGTSLLDFDKDIKLSIQSELYNHIHFK